MILLFDAPVKGTGGTGFNAFAAVGAAGGQSLFKGGADTGGKASEFG